MSKSSQLRNRAQNFLKKGKFDKAIGEYKKLLTVESRNPNLYNELGDIYLRANDRVQAVSSFEKASINYEKVALYNNAVAVCKKILRIVPNRLDTVYKLGEIKTKQKFIGEAETYFLQYFDVIISEPESTGGKIQEKTENVLQLIPDCEGIWSRASDVFNHIGLKSRAAQILAELISKTSLTGDAQKLNFYRSRLDLLKQSLKREEIEELEKITSSSGSEPIAQGHPVSDGVDAAGIDLNENAGNIPGVRSETGAKDQLYVDDVRKVEAPESTSGTTDAAVSSVANETGGESDSKESRNGSDTGAQSIHGDTSATLAEDLSDIIEQEDAEIESEASIGDLAREITSDVEEDDHRSHYDLGMAYIEMGLFKDAVRELQISSKSQLLQLQSLEMIGFCFLSIGNPRIAVKQLERGLELSKVSNGDNLGIHYNLGLAFESLGDNENAREHFEEVYIVDVTFRDISEKMKKFSTVS